MARERIAEMVAEAEIWGNHSRVKSAPGGCTAGRF